MKLFFDKFIATGFGAGYSPFAPGTAGALVATLIWWGLSCLVSSTHLFFITLAFIFIFTGLGIITANHLEPIWGEDPSRVVVDEMVGVWIPLLVVPVTHSHWYLFMIAAFALFRLFDIFKPLGIRAMESLKGGLGVMMDDILAGIYSLLILLISLWWVA